ncbi:linoleoyl-CoA desaturase [Flavobacterium fluvii]|uniref:Linoleoyl-CoA desaturase n=1 Tax=Flavobacterium fluvii TaxID=468056 RepID=A0A1M5NSL3_9FLAO|nr:fatty acid desaturase [Flavobacterium fluvii]SHG92500.1 linoleoyl-CoA desaturase [Flavobacterium fluvii]
MFEKPTFTKCAEEDRNFILLKESIKERLNTDNKDYQNQIKVFLLPFFYFLFWLAAMQYRSIPLLYYVFYGLIGIATTLIFANLIHEACHQTLFKQKWKNKVVIYFFDCIGANSFIWINRHIRMHHNYPNIIGWDTDIEQGGPIKLFPSDKHSTIQKYQHYWAFFLYPFFFINWVLLRDFKDFYISGRYIKKVIKIPLIEHFKLWFFKSLFISFILIIPILVFKVGVAQALLGFLTQMIIGSLFGMVILLPTHANVGNEFPIPDSNSKLQTSWIRHQFNTVNDVSGQNFITKHLMNNFNYHLAHHLFPNISSIYADQLTEIIKDFAKEHQYPYKSYSLLKGIQLHYQLIKRNAIEPQSFFEETM